MTDEPRAKDASEPGDVGPETSAGEPTNPTQPSPLGTTASEKPKSIRHFIEYAYGRAGRKLNLTQKDLRQLRLEQGNADAEMTTLHQRAAEDRLLSVPPVILLAIAEFQVEPDVRRRLLDLVTAALCSHPVFAPHWQQLTNPSLAPSLEAAEVSAAAQGLTYDALGLETSADFKEAHQERLRTNAVVAFELLGLLHGGRNIDAFVADMAALVWISPPRRRVQESAALLAGSPSIEALSQICRHFERLLNTADHSLQSSRAEARQHLLWAQRTEEAHHVTTVELNSERARVHALAQQLEAVTRRLESERTRRVVDQSHLVNDYEALRTQVVRRLTSQVELLSDGLHALRNGSTNVAEEFIDRSLSAMEAEVTRLKQLDGGSTG